MNLLLALALAGSSPASAQACQRVADAPEALQVAWLSLLSDRAGREEVLEVVRVADLRQWIRDNGTDVGRLLQGLGMAPRNASRKADKDWKVTVFDVRSEWMCRPTQAGEPGENLGGMEICDEKDGGRLRPHRWGYSACGYTLDTGASTRGLDVYRVTWSAASAYGFCVMPLERFLGGA